MNWSEAQRIMTAIVRARGCDCAVTFVPRPALWGVPGFRAVHETHCKSPAAKGPPRNDA